MIRNFRGAVAALALCAAPLVAQGTLSQSIDNVTVAGGIGIACSNAGPPQTTTANSFWRSYNIVAEGVFQNIDVNQVSFGIENLVSGTGLTATNITVNLYTDPTAVSGVNSLLPAVGSLLPAYSETFSIPNTASGTKVTVALSTSVPFTVSDTIVVEISAPDLSTVAGTFFPGGNAQGETAPSYLSASACGLPNPTPYSAIGFLANHLIIDLDWVPSGTAFAYPGSGEDLQLRTGVGLANTPVGGLGNDVKTCTAGDFIQVVIESTGGTFALLPHVLVGEIFTTGVPPIGPAAPFNTVHFNPTSPNLIGLVIGTNITPLGFNEIVNPGGNLHIYTVPPGMSGFSVLLQDLVPTNMAANGFFAITNGHELQIL